MFARDPRLAQVQVEVSHPDGRIRRPDGSFDRDGLSIEPFVESVGVPRFEVVEAGAANTKAREDVQRLAAVDNPRLIDVGETWLRHKMNERGLDYSDREQRVAIRRVGKKNRLTDHMRDTLAGWQSFVDCVGNVRIAELTAANFRKFHQWADRESAGKASNRWHGQLMTAVKNVFNYTQRHYTDWDWPPGINERVRAYTPKKYQAAASNAERHTYVHSDASAGGRTPAEPLRAAGGPNIRVIGPSTRWILDGMSVPLATIGAPNQFGLCEAAS